MRRGSQEIHDLHTLLRFDLQSPTIAADMSDVECVLVLVDVNVMPFAPLVRKQKIPDVVRSGQLVGERLQFLHEIENRGCKVHSEKQSDVMLADRQGRHQQRFEVDGPCRLFSKGGGDTRSGPVHSLRWMVRWPWVLELVRAFHSRKIDARESRSGNDEVGMESFKTFAALPH